VIRRYLLLLLLVVGAVMVLTWGRAQQLQTVQRSRLIMGTLVEIRATGRDPLVLHQLMEASFAEMVRIEERMSPHLPGSEVARLGEVTEMEVSEDTRRVLELGLEVARRSHGAFDLNLGELLSLWNFTGAEPRIPEPGEIAAAIEGLGPDALSLEGRHVRKRMAYLKPDLGAIAKGYAVEAAARILRDERVQNASVNAGGDMALIGRPAGRAWKIGVRHPRRNGELLATLRLDGGAVVTSGDYERFFEVDGVRYHHLLDPRSGYPARGCQSVTVTAEEATLADALATAAFVLGPEQGLQLLEEWPGVEGLMVAADGEVRTTSGLEGRVTWP